MKLKIVVVFVACISCLVPPAFSIGFLTTKALAVGTAKGAAAIAVKCAILKGAALLAKGAAIKGAAAKALLLGSAALLGAKTLKAGALTAGSKLPLPLPPPYFLHRPYIPENNKSSSSAIEVSQNPSVSAISVPHKPSVVEIEIQQRPSGSQVNVLSKPSDVDVNFEQNSSDLGINVSRRPTKTEIYRLQKPLEVDVYDSQEHAVEDVDNKPYYVLLPVTKTVQPVSDKLRCIMGILQSAIQDKTEVVHNFLRSLQMPLFVKQPVIYQIINKPKILSRASIRLRSTHVI